MLPILILSVLGIVNLFLGFSRNKGLQLPFAVVSVLAALGAVYAEYVSGYAYTSSAVNSMMTTDKVSAAFSGIILLAGLLVLPLSEKYIAKPHAQAAEYFSIMLFALVGALMMVSFENLLMLFLGLEILSISLYVLTGSDKRNLRGNEAALKYLLMGSFATGVLLFGVALLYGASGSFSLSEIALFVDGLNGQSNPMLYMGLLLVLIGILFKLSAAPFHFWTPDVYEGAPTVFTAFMATVVKVAGFGALYKLLSVSFADVYNWWWATVAGVSALTLVVGNLAAAQQTSVKRMLAYSGISHAGYMLIAVAALSGRSQEAIIFYSLSYTLATVAAFGVLIAVSDKKHNGDNFESFNGLASADPLCAAAMAVSMLSMAGIPLTGGFFGKFFVFSAALEKGLVWMLIVAVLMSAVGVYYYFKVIIAMYFRSGTAQKPQVSGLFRLVLLLCTAATLVLGLIPGLTGI